LDAKTSPPRCVGDPGGKIQEVALRTNPQARFMKWNGARLFALWDVRRVTIGRGFEGSPASVSLLEENERAPVASNERIDAQPSSSD